MSSAFKKHPKPPYYAVIFCSEIDQDEAEKYGRMSEKMNRLAARQPGFLGLDETARDNGLGLNISYWKDEASIKAWKENAEHIIARQTGRRKWYKWFHLRVARVERSYSFEKGK